MDTKLRVSDREGIFAFSHALLLGAQFEIEKCRQSGNSDLLNDTLRELQAFCNTIKDSLEAAAIKKTGLNYKLEHDLHASSEPLAPTNYSLASLAIEHFDLSAPVSELERAFALASQLEQETPLARLPASGFLENLRSQACTHLLRLAASDLDISLAEAEFVGLEGLLMRRRLQSPPNWSKWNSTAARKTREELGWTKELLRKGQRQVLGPVRRAHHSELDRLKYVKAVENLVAQTNENGPNDQLMFDSLCSLGDRLCSDDTVSKVAIEQSFPSYGAMSEHRDHRADADPFNFLVYLSAQIAWRGVLEGWVACLAQDGFDERIFSWIPKEEFPELSDTGELVLPSEIDVKSCFELDVLARERCSASKLWFVLLQDLNVAFEEPQKTFATTPARRFNSGLNSTDKKFVEEGLQMVLSGQARSAQNAAEQLVAKYDVVLVNKLQSKPDAIPTTSPNNAVGRLQKKISERLRSQLPK